jgi:glycosyltransferase involved in cell wall biosynthesis
MVIHNAGIISRRAVLKTLRHINGQDARLIVVDNASDDGIEEWLNCLRITSTIDLIRLEKALSHGEALETAVVRSSSRYIVTLDSDAFPLNDNWLKYLRSLITNKTKVSGILHHRDYIHPSCLLIERKTLAEYKLNFLQTYTEGSKFDVAERISFQLKQQGFEIAGLCMTESLCRGSKAEPVYLGSSYENLVFHQWYSTRAIISNGNHVDDVPINKLNAALSQTVNRLDAEFRDVTVIFGVQAAIGTKRLRRAVTCLRALSLQDLPRWRYRLIVVEQGIEPVARDTLSQFFDQYIFAYNPGAYNRGWAFNIGATAKYDGNDVLCLIDSDLLVPPDFLRSNLQKMTLGYKAILPYTKVVYLNEFDSDRASSLSHEFQYFSWDSNCYEGNIFENSEGGCLWIYRKFYLEIGGHDERFQGWGREDREVMNRIRKHTNIYRTEATLLHLHHERTENDADFQKNSQLYQRLLCKNRNCNEANIGNINRYEYSTNKPEQDLTLHNPVRDWQNWNKWSDERIGNIVVSEKSSRLSNRMLLSKVIKSLGNSLLDVGCGPGAIWEHFKTNKSHFRLVGVDLTQEMIFVARKFFPDVPVVLGDSGNLPIQDNSFDITLIRHVLEHLPHWLLKRTLRECLRTARKKVLISFYIAPSSIKTRRTRRVGENFLESEWTTDDIREIIEQDGWGIQSRLSLGIQSNSIDEVLVLAPKPRLPSKRKYTGVENPLVSIIMPTYDRPHTVFKTINHIQLQHYKNWELILVENSGRQQYGFDDPRIRSFRYCEQASSSYARNQGLKHVRGELVCYFDDDDDMDPQYLSRFVQTFNENPDAKMVRCGMSVSDDSEINYSYATPQCWLRRPFATNTWSSRGPAQDQKYFRAIIEKNGWTEKNGDIVSLNVSLCHANTDPVGGLRHGNF